MNDRIRCKCLIFLVLIFCLGLLSTSYSEEKFKVDIDVGFDGYVKQNELTPVRIEIKNNFEDIEGKIELLVHEKRNQKDFYTAYSKEINLAKDATKIINMESIFYRNGLLYVRIVDKNDKVIFKKMVKYLQMNRPDGMFMGVFSEDVDRLRYLSKIQNMNYPSGSRESFFEIAELDDTLPENHKALKVFQAIVINNYDSEKLNTKQREALKEWIEAGGLLLVGTGPNYQKTLKGLGDINFIEVQGTKEINVDKFDSKKPLKLVNAALKDGEEVFIGGNEELKLYHKKLGQGHVIITGFDMELSPFVKWDGKDKFIGQVINKYISSDIDNQNDIRMRSHWFENIVSYLPYHLLPSMGSILIILILFILLVGPINYFVLKRIDKRELLWITIPIIVVLFSASIYILGFKTRLREPITNNISIVKIDNEEKTAIINSKSGIMGFKNGDWDVSIDKNSEILLDERRDYDVLQRFADEEVITEYIFDKENHIIFKKAGILDVETIAINSELDINDKIVTDIVIKDGKLVGSVNNVSGLTLEDMVIFYGSRYEKLGSFKDGETSKKFEVNISNHHTIKDWYGIIDSLYGHSGQRFKNSKDDAENILNDNMKRDILEGLMDSKDPVISKNRFFILAWNKDQIINTIQVNGKKVKSIDRNLLLIPLSIKYEKGEKVSIPYGVLYPEIEENHNMHLERNNSILYGEGYVVFRFNPQENMELSSMEIDLGAIQNKSIYETYVFNYSKNEWEKWEEKDMIIDASNKNKYYQSDRGTLIKIDPTKDTDILIPTFKVEGDIK